MNVDVVFAVKIDIIRKLNRLPWSSTSMKVFVLSFAREKREERRQDESDMVW